MALKAKDLDWRAHSSGRDDTNDDRPKSTIESSDAIILHNIPGNLSCTPNSWWRTLYSLLPGLYNSQRE